MEYGSYLPDHIIEAFRNASKTHHIHLAPIFFPNGKRISPDEFPICLENAVVEIMFSLRHYYYTGPTTTGRFKPSGKEGNTFTGTIEQIKILQLNTVVPPPLREPTIKNIQQTPEKGKAPDVGSKRPNALPPTESSPTQAKKKKIEGKRCAYTVLF